MKYYENVNDLNSALLRRINNDSRLVNLFGQLMFEGSCGYKLIRRCSQEYTKVHE